LGRRRQSASADPVLEASDQRRLQHEPFLFPTADLHKIGAFIGESLRSRLDVELFALTVQTWHVHFVAAASPHDAPAIVKCVKEAVRYGLRIRRPIWTDDYDKRFCFDIETLHTRILYVERHNTERGLPPRPWPFIVKPTF
jgi:hypothetical protein